MSGQPLLWTAELIATLTDLYPRVGVKKCADMMGLKAHQVRHKASRLGLRSRGISEAWHRERCAHSVRMTGRKRPGQSDVMKRLHAEGKLCVTDEMRAAISKRMKEWYANNPHPRGAFGMKHSCDAKEKMSAKGKERWRRMSNKEREEYVTSMIQASIKKGTHVQQRPNASWKAGWREVGGRRKFFRSKWEANYARYLEWLRSLGEISSWEHEPKTFWFEGIKRGVRSYLPDFLIIENDGSESYHEVKGWMDDRSKTKIKRMAKYHPTVRLIVIDGKSYREISKKVGGMIDGWE